MTSINFQRLRHYCKLFALCSQGTNLIEFCILLPVFLLLMLGAIEFGWYFVKNESAARSVGIVALAIQSGPSSGGLQTLANSSGTGYTYGQNGNYICAMSYATLAAAQTQLCTAGAWSVGLPAGVSSGTPYYVAIKAYVAPSPFTSFIPAINTLSITHSAVIQTSMVNHGSTWVTVPNNPPLPDTLCQNNNYTRAAGPCTVTGLDHSLNPDATLTQGLLNTFCYDYGFHSCWYSCLVPNRDGTGMLWDQTNPGNQILCE